MKSINWKNLVTILVVGAIGAVVVAPLISGILTPLLKKLPVVGSKY